VDIRRLQPGDEELVVAASHLFDGPADGEATRRFLADERHHLLVAYVGGRAAGFVSGVEMTHPDKGTEMLLYELAVDEPFRNAGLGRALVARLGELAVERGCYGMWVLTDDDNGAALATYTAAGGVRRGVHVMLDWTF
jgi:ribosomal protein S18 acetylase RimI-like enzyme